MQNFGRLEEARKFQAKMTQAEVVSQIVKQTGIHKLDVQVVVKLLFQVIKNTMISGESVHFKGFGKFVNKKRARKIARNLATNTALILDEHYVPTMKPARNFMMQIREQAKA